MRSPHVFLICWYLSSTELECGVFQLYLPFIVTFVNAENVYLNHPSLLSSLSIYAVSGLLKNILASMLLQY
jgi:hypothetical protein